MNNEMTKAEIIKAISENPDSQDILQFDIGGGLGFDLGAYYHPDRDLSYKAVVFKNGNYHDQVVAVSTFSREIIAEEAERLIKTYGKTYEICEHGGPVC